MSQVQNNILHNFIQPTLFLSMAYIAGSKRMIQHFSGATKNGLILSAALGSGIALASQKFTAEEESAYYSFMRVTASVALGVIIAPYVARSLGGRVDITLPASLRLGVLETISSMGLAIVSSLITKQPHPQPTLQEQHQRFVQNLDDLKARGEHVSRSDWSRLSWEDRARLMLAFYRADLSCIDSTVTDFSNMEIALPPVEDYSTLTFNRLVWESSPFFSFKRDRSIEAQFDLNQALNAKNLPMCWNFTSELVQAALINQEYVNLLYSYFELNPLELRIQTLDTIQKPLINRFQNDGKEPICWTAVVIHSLSEGEIRLLNLEKLRFVHDFFTESDTWQTLSGGLQQAFNAAFDRNKLTQF